MANRLLVYLADRRGLGYNVAMIRIACIVMVPLLFTGCIGIETPEAQVTSIRLEDTSEAGGRIAFDVSLFNPNDEELPMPTVNYTVDVVGAGSFDFTGAPYAAAPQNDSVLLTFAAGVPGVNLAGKRVRVSGDFVFEPRGEIRRVLYDNFYPLPRTSFSGEGVLEASSADASR